MARNLAISLTITISPSHTLALTISRDLDIWGGRYPSPEEACDHCDDAHCEGESRGDLDLRMQDMNECLKENVVATLTYVCRI